MCSKGMSWQLILLKSFFAGFLQLFDILWNWIN